MSILNSNEIGVVHKKVNEYYETSSASLRYTNIFDVVEEVLHREYPIESMPTPDQLYDMIADELRRFKIEAKLTRSNIDFLDVGRDGINLGWIYILYKS